MSSGNRGSVLILSFWALIILMLMSFGITRRVNTELSLAKYQIGRVRSRYAAFAGLFYALDQVRMRRSGPGSVDTLFACGVFIPEGGTARDLFSDRQVGDAVFQIMDAADEPRFGLGDETGKINLNALRERNYNILEFLLKGLDVPEDQARTVAASVVDWRDHDDRVFLEPFGAENDYYQSLQHPYECKNYPFETIEELFLVRGMTEDIFEKLRPYVTVYPLEGLLKVNFNTAPEPVLLALAQSVTGARTNTTFRDAQDFVRVLTEFRSGSDGIWGTADDREIILGRMSLSGPRLAIASALMPIYSQRAAFLRTRIIGKDPENRVTTTLEAVIKTDSLAVVSLSVQ